MGGSLEMLRSKRDFAGTPGCEPEPGAPAARSPVPPQRTAVQTASASPPGSDWAARSSAIESETDPGDAPGMDRNDDGWDVLVVARPASATRKPMRSFGTRSTGS